MNDCPVCPICRSNSRVYYDRELHFWCAICKRPFVEKNVEKTEAELAVARALEEGMRDDLCSLPGAKEHLQCLVENLDEPDQDAGVVVLRWLIEEVERLLQNGGAGPGGQKQPPNKGVDEMIYSLPKVGECVQGYGVLVAVEDATSDRTDATLDYIFETRTMRVESRVNDKVVRKYGEYDASHKLSVGLEFARAEAKRRADEFGPSDLEFVVVQVTRRHRHRPTVDKCFYDPAFCAFRYSRRHANDPRRTKKDVWLYRCKREDE